MQPRPRRTSPLLVALVLLLTGLLAAPPAGAAEPDPAQSGSALANLGDLIGDLGERVRDLARAEADARAAAKAEERRAGEAAVPCSAITGADIPQLVADVFRCRLREAGFAEPDVTRIVAEAVTVSQCESQWDPNAIVFDGRYLYHRHPATGMFYSAAGVFQFIRRSADRWIEGGYANVLDPTLNIDAAARLFIDNVRRGYGGWGDWACAAANDGFKATSVLPGWPGGPAALPDWAYGH